MPDTPRPPVAAGTRLGRVSGVDSLRAFAALSVFFCHLVAYWGLTPSMPWKTAQLFQVGAHGVDLFIVISGFCLALPVVVRGGTLATRSFLVRRAFRILPPYYLAVGLAAAFALGPSTYSYVVATQAGLGDLVQHIFLVQTWTGSIVTINASLWSVALEVHLYLLFPLLVAAWRRWGLDGLVVGTAALSVAWDLAAVGHFYNATFVFPDRLVQFVVGMWCAERLVTGRVPPQRVLLAGLLGGGLVALLASTADLHVGVSAMWSVPTGCLVLLVTSKFSDALAGSRSDRFGQITFSFYLLHQPVLLISRRLLGETPLSAPALLVLGSTAVLGITVTLSVLMYHLVELPSIRLGRTAAARWGGTRPAQVRQET